MLAGDLLSVFDIGYEGVRRDSWASSVVLLRLLLAAEVSGLLSAHDPEVHGNEGWAGGPED